MSPFISSLLCDWSCSRGCDSRHAGWCCVTCFQMRRLMVIKRETSPSVTSCNISLASASSPDCNLGPVKLTFLSSGQLRFQNSVISCGKTNQIKIKQKKTTRGMFRGIKPVEVWYCYTSGQLRAAAAWRATPCWKVDQRTSDHFLGRLKIFTLREETAGPRGADGDVLKGLFVVPGPSQSGFR